ncbi:asparagine synthase-related protein [Jannaschia seohaensis]|uniref:Asparagine synthase n=1 Tax=Jannaschia seohaensis TaxID=475081 RepID=A0A2Y9C328_9RHOB|nr:asparagine synthase-related protein [Jannaschia seohaensis]PWJ12944.1 asparagine synthase [Jannaschia seohaensis]SSA50752.1 Asparagine synthase [Jannaschia seohaensis]
MSYSYASASPLRNESLYLMYRRFFPIPAPSQKLTPVSTAQEMHDYIAQRMGALATQGKIGIMLSGGMDSVMLAKFLPEGSIAYTLDYGEGQEQHSEFAEAAKAIPPGVTHKKLSVTREAYAEMARELTLLKREPLVPHDPAFGIGARVAREDGITHMVYGGGADPRFAGFAHFYKDPSYEGVRKAIIKQFVAPWHVLKSPAPVDWVLGHFTVGNRVDVRGFLNIVGTEGQAVSDTLRACGLTPVAPLAEMVWTHEFDIAGRGGKYPLRDLFKLIYPGKSPNKKAPLPVPYGAWMKGYVPARPEFRTDRLHWFGGKNLYQIYALELYMDLRDAHGWETPPGDRLMA